MERIVRGEQDDGYWWLNQLNVPQYVINLIVLKRHNMSLEDARVTVQTFEGPVSALRIPADDMGFATEEAVHDTILAAMGYGEEDLPKSVSTETLQEMWNRD